MRAIIVDDEPKAIELLKSYLQHFNSIHLVETFRNGLKAFEFLSKEKVDLVFLDINMPHISGISLSKMIGPETRVIFTTAYSSYAVESYDVQALDYLLKPISLERFTKAVSKVMAVSGATTRHFTAGDTLMIKSGTKFFRLNPNDIFYLEKEGNYITYHTENKKILTRESIVDALERLPSFFTQTHKSYIININKINSLDTETIQILNTSIPIGATYKDKLMGTLTKMFPGNNA